MAKYRIAWMPGDGVGNDVMEAARIVLDRMKFDAEYVPCDIGWKFWCKEGNALPDRTVKALKDTTCALFGAITSKAQDKAKEELSPGLKSGQSSELPREQNHKPERRRRANRSSRLSREYRRHVRRSRIFPTAGIGLHRAVRESKNEEVEGKGGS
jgi:hypothetical protein